MFSYMIAWQAPDGEVELKSVFTEEYEIFLLQLVSARKSAGLTQQDLARHLNKAQSFVSKYERGERRLDVVEFIAICRILNIDPNNIVNAIKDFTPLRSNNRKGATQ